MTTKAKTKKEVYWRCKKCGDEIYWNTHKSMTYCKCKALGVDGCEFYSPRENHAREGVDEGAAAIFSS